VDFRVLLTNGPRMIKLAWLEHTGRDVYAGIVHMPGKFSYHESGQFHFKGRQGTEFVEKKIPVKQIHGSIPLFSMAFLPGVVSSSGLPDYERKPLDAIALLDTRTMPDDQVVNMHFGLLEPFRIGDLAVPTNVRQVFVVTLPWPWVYVTVAWGKITPEATRES
jgi:hypothetical protein